jgi:hypothetical protein
VSVDALSESGRRYRVHARTLPFTPSWFWEIIDTVQGSIVENSLALSRSVYRSSSEARAAGLRYLERAATAADAA